MIEILTYLLKFITTLLSLGMQIIIYGLSLSTLLGQVLVKITAFLLSNTISIFLIISYCCEVLIEDFGYFAKDVFKKIGFIILCFQNTAAVLKSAVIGILMYFANGISLLGSYIFLQIDQLVLLISNTCNRFCSTLQVLRDALLLIGSAIWCAVCFIPNSFLYVAQVVKMNAVSILLHIKNYLIELNDQGCIVLADILNYITEVPIESLLGLAIGAFFLFLGIQYKELFKEQGIKCLKNILIIIRNLVALCYRITHLHSRIIILRNNCVRNFGKVQAWFPNKNLFRATCNEANNLDKNNFEYQLEKEREERLCIVCKDQPKTIILLPCRHFCLCAQCCYEVQQRDKNCPMCRRHIQRKLAVYS